MNDKPASSKDTGAFGYTIPGGVGLQTVVLSQPLIFAATTPNYIGVIMTDSLPVVTNYNVATTANYNVAATSTKTDDEESLKKPKKRAKFPDSDSNQDPNPYIGKVKIKEELILEDSDALHGKSEEAYFEELECNQRIMWNPTENSNEYPSGTEDGNIPFEIVNCNDDIQVKQEIVEDVMEASEISHGPESVSTCAVAATIETSSKRISVNGGQSNLKSGLPKTINNLGTVFKPTSVPGRRRGSKLYTNGDGYFYNLRWSNPTKSHYICYKKNCDARVWASPNLPGIQRNTSRSWHNHKPEHFIEPLHKLRQTIISRVERESLPDRRIFDEECSKVPEEVSKHLNYSQIESNLKKARKKCFPQLPSSPEEFHEMLTSPEWHDRFITLNGKKFYRSNEVIDGKNNLLFVSENLEWLFEVAEVVHFEVITKNLPSMPRIKQLLVVMAVTYDHGFPVCYILMEDRCYSSYKGILAAIKKLVPGLEPKVAISDFEKCLMKAVSEEFPETEIKGYWRHYADRVLKKAKSLGIGSHLFERDEDVRRLIQMCMALPLLPQDKIEVGLAEVRAMLAKLAQETLACVFTSLLDYIQSQWIKKVGVDRMSVWGDPMRTNNDSELLHSSFKREMKTTQPDARMFISGLKNLENSYLADLEKIQNSNPLRRGKMRRYLAKERCVRLAAENLVSGPTNEKDFLSVVASVIDSKVNFSPSEEEEVDEASEDEEEEVERPPSPLVAAGTGPDPMAPDTSRCPFSNDEQSDLDNSIGATTASCNASPTPISVTSSSAVSTTSVNTMGTLSSATNSPTLNATYSPTISATNTLSSDTNSPTFSATNTLSSVTNTLPSDTNPSNISATNSPIISATNTLSSATNLPATSATNTPANRLTNTSNDVPAVSANTTQSHSHQYENSSHTSDCERLGVFISLEKIPLEKRKKTEDKLLGLVKLISELNLDPEEVRFSVAFK